MTRIDFSPLYRSTVGFDRLASMLDNAAELNQGAAGYPPYNIESLAENQYAITIAAAGFDDADLEIVTERGVLSVKGNKTGEAKEQRNFLYQGIATRNFERKFQLADYVEVSAAELRNGLLTIQLEKKIPEAMKPKRIAINGKVNATVETEQQAQIKAA